jgi:hypothetical protein
MRALSLALPLYAIGGLIYLTAGGSTGWQFGVVHGAAMVASLFLIVRTILHIRRNDALSSDDKVTWVLLTLLFGFITLPIYWFVMAKRPPRRDDASGRAATA